MPSARQYPRVGQAGHCALALLLLTMAAACAREDEADLRARLSQWFALGETVAFNSTKTCAAGVFRLTDTRVKSAMPLTQAPGDMIRALNRRDVAALDDPTLTPDAAIVGIVNVSRETGRRMRRQALEARLCMDDTTESAFRHVLLSPKAILAFDMRHSTLILIDPQTGLLVVGMGAE